MNSKLQELVFASSNEHKIAEMRTLSAGKFRILSSADAGIYDDIEETGSSFKENAAIKARFIWQKTKKTCFSDDSGLTCSSLDGEPGIFSARYAGTGKSADNISLLLKKLEFHKDRSAAFICVICLIQNGVEYYFEGSVSGTISNDLKGTEGFGYDPIFIPLENSKSFAEMTEHEKNLNSHRANAMAQLITFLEGSE